MTDAANNRKIIYIRWALLRFAMIIFDIFAVNAAYFLALLIRYYVNFEFNVWALTYLSAFIEFAPYYTVASLVVFGFLGLYKSLWKYAGLSDMNRILAASVITCVIHVAGTLLFIRRMPITYYVLGAAFQLVLITLCRFSYRLIMVEKDNFFIRKKRDTVNVLVVGFGEACRTVINHLKRESDSIAKPVCMIDVSNTEFAGTLAGVPVMRGIASIPEAIRKYKVDRVLLADSILPSEMRSAVKEACNKMEVSVQDFSSYFQRAPRKIPLKVLLEYVEAPVIIETERERVSFDSLSQEARSRFEKYIVSSVYTEEDSLCIRIIQDLLCPNDVQADWVQDYQKETGENISFF